MQSPLRVCFRSLAFATATFVFAVLGSALPTTGQDATVVPDASDAISPEESAASKSADVEDTTVNEGQSDLDEAIVKRIDADSPQALETVSALIESALQKGLDKENKSFAKKMLASVQLQRAQQLLAGLENARGRRKATILEETLLVLEQAVENDPTLVEGYALIARLNLVSGGDRQTSTEAVTKAIELLDEEPAQQSAMLVLRSLTVEGDDAKMTDLNRALELDEKNQEARQLRAGLRFQVEDIEGAIEDLEVILLEDPTNEMMAGTAIDKLIKLERVDEATDLVTKLLAAKPSEGMYRMRAILYQAKGKLDEAMGDLDKAIAMAPKDPRTLMQRALIALDRDDVKSAKSDFRAATQVAPQILAIDQGIEVRLQIALKENRMADAINDAQLLSDREPDNVFRRLRLASLYSIDKRPRKAIDVMSGILEDDPRNVAVLRSRGDALLSVGDHSAAIEDYEEAISVLGNIDPEEASLQEIEEASGLYNNLSWVLATSPNDSIRNGKRALELAEMSSKLTDYKAPHILSTLAAAYAETGDFENARKWSDKAVEIATEQEHDQLDQLKEETEAYKKDEPWREKQETEENQVPILDPADLIDT